MNDIFEVYLLRSLDDPIDIEQMVDDFWFFFAFADHKQDTHHQPHLMP
jgi:hypothetical protein